MRTLFSFVQPYAGVILGVILGWLLTAITRHNEEVWFGARLHIDCQRAPGNKSETCDDVYVKFRVCNKAKRRVAKNCRAYLVDLRKLSNSKIVSETSSTTPRAKHGTTAETNSRTKLQLTLKVGSTVRG